MKRTISLFTALLVAGCGEKGESSDSADSGTDLSRVETVMAGICPAEKRRKGAKEPQRIPPEKEGKSAEGEEHRRARENVGFAPELAQLTEAAGKGDAKAQNDLGDLYLHGRGVEKNPAEAVKWFQKAARARNAKALTTLGDCYLAGDGVGKDHEEAVRSYHIAAEQGHGDAQYALGSLHARGHGKEVPINYTKAFKWLEICRINLQKTGPSALTSPVSLLEISREVFKKAPRSEVDEGTKLAKEWYADWEKRNPGK